MCGSDGQDVAEWSQAISHVRMLENELHRNSQAQQYGDGKRHAQQNQREDSDGEIDLLRDRYGTHRVLVVTLQDPVERVEVAGAEVESSEGNVVWRLRFDRRAVSAEVLIRRVADAYCVSDLSIEEPELESIIRRIYLEGYSPAPGSTAGEPSTAPA